MMIPIPKPFAESFTKHIHNLYLLLYYQKLLQFYQRSGC